MIESDIFYLFFFFFLQRIIPIKTSDTSNNIKVYESKNTSITTKLSQNGNKINIIVKILMITILFFIILTFSLILI